MNPRLHVLALEKQKLALRSEILREQFASAAGVWEPACHGVDRLRQAVAWLRRRPLPLIALGVALFVARPRAVLRLAGRGWVVWRTLRHWRAHLRKVEGLGVGIGRDRKAGSADAGLQRGGR